MPTWPPREGCRTVTLHISAAHLSHLDAQANRAGCSRAAYLRSALTELAAQSEAPAPELAGGASRAVTFELPEPLIGDLDRIAAVNGCSRAALIRSIVSADMRRQVLER